jgi:hypothetical protein
MSVRLESRRSEANTVSLNEPLKNVLLVEGLGLLDSSADAGRHNVVFFHGLRLHSEVRNGWERAALLCVGERTQRPRVSSSVSAVISHPRKRRAMAASSIVARVSLLL